MKLSTMKNVVSERAAPSRKQLALAEMSRLEEEIRAMLDESLQGMERVRSIERENEVRMRELEQQITCSKD